jgi:hypothetical protein
VSINKDKEAPIFKHSTYGIVDDMFKVVPVLTAALAGGEMPQFVTTETKAKEPATPKEVSATSSTKPEKKATTTAKQPSKPDASKIPITSSIQPPVDKGYVGSSNQTTPPVQALDPRIMDELKEQMNTLKTEISTLKSSLTKSIKDHTAVIKKDIQRVEQNSRSFQDSATKRIENVDKSVTNEVRRIREKIRVAIANDTGRIQDLMFSLKGTSTANTVLSILCLMAILGLYVLR